MSRLVLTAAGAAIAATLVTACGSSGSSSASGNSGITSITVTQPFTSTLNSALYIAQSQGYFKQHHLNVKFVTVSNGNGLSATLGGSAQLALVSSVLPMQALAQGQKFDVFAASGLGFPESIFVSSSAYAKSGLNANSTLKQQLEFLANKPIAVESPSGENDTVFKFLFHLAGLPASDFKPEVLGTPAAILAAIKNGTAVASALGSPYPQEASADGYAKILLNLSRGDVKQMTDILTLCIAATQSYYNANPTVIQEFTAALQEGQDYVYAHTSAAAAYMAKTYFSSSSESVIAAGLNAQIKGGAISKSAEITQASVSNLVTFMDNTGQSVSSDYMSIFPTLAS